MRIERVILEHHRDIAVLGRQVHDILAADGQGSATDLLKPGDHPQGGGFSASGWTHEYQELPVIDRETEILDGVEFRPVCLANLCQHNNSHVTSSRCGRTFRRLV